MFGIWTSEAASLAIHFQYRLEFKKEAWTHSCSRPAYLPRPQFQVFFCVFRHTPSIEKATGSLFFFSHTAASTHLLLLFWLPCFCFFFSCHQLKTEERERKEKRFTVCRRSQSRKNGSSLQGVTGWWGRQRREDRNSGRLYVRKSCHFVAL